LAENCQADFCHLASRLTGDVSTAEDAVQEAWMSIRDHAGDCRAAEQGDEAGARAWMRSIVTHASFRIRAQRKRDRLPDMPRPPEVDPLVAKERAELVRTALADLPEAQRAAVVLHHLDGEPFTAVARALGCSAVAARVRAHRGLAALRRRLGRLDPALGGTGCMTVLGSDAPTIDLVPTAIHAPGAGAKPLTFPIATSGTLMVILIPVALVAGVLGAQPADPIAPAARGPAASATTSTIAILDPLAQVMDLEHALHLGDQADLTRTLIAVCQGNPNDRIRAQVAAQRASLRKSIPATAAMSAAELLSDRTAGNLRSIKVLRLYADTYAVTDVLLVLRDGRWAAHAVALQASNDLARILNGLHTGDFTPVPAGTSPCESHARRLADAIWGLSGESAESVVASLRSPRTNPAPLQEFSKRSSEMQAAVAARTRLLPEDRRTTWVRLGSRVEIVRVMDHQDDLGLSVLAIYVQDAGSWTLLSFGIELRPIAELFGRIPEFEFQPSATFASTPEAKGF
jgi:RNA polymerase sigma-70 factor (ECF subfamily)